MNSPARGRAFDARVRGGAVSSRGRRRVVRRDALAGERIGLARRPLVVHVALATVHVAVQADLVLPEQVVGTLALGVPPDIGEVVEGVVVVTERERAITAV